MHRMRLATGLAATLLLAPTLGAAQRSDVSMVPLLLKVIGADTLLENQNLEIVRIEMDIVAGIKESFRTLTNQWVYGVAAIGDDRVADIDVAVYRELDGQWSLVQQDQDNGALATVTVQPTNTERYKFVVSATYKTGYTSAHYALLIYHR